MEWWRELPGIAGVDVAPEPVEADASLVAIPVAD